MNWLKYFLACLILAVPVGTHAGILTAGFSSISQGSIVNLTAQGTADWIHWGLFTETSVDRKVNVSPQISNFTPVDASNGYVYIYQYSDNFNGYSWSDGTPHMSATNTTTGVWAYGVPAVGSGFRFDVTASTNIQTLKIYVGAFAAKGKLLVYLSDSSAAGYTNNTAINNISNGPSGVFTVNFAANSPNQALHVVWTLDQLRGGGGAGNITLQAAALSAPGVNNLPFIALTEPLDRASFSSTNMIPLSANAGDSDGTVNVVEFYAGTNKVGAAASAPYSVVWTNPQPGSYTLTARAIDNAGGVGISSPVTIFVSGAGGALSGTRSNSPASVDLTVEGISDWAHWGSYTAASFDHKATGNSQISNFTLIGTNAANRYSDNFTAFSWSDGVPLAVTNGSTTGIDVTGAMNGFEIRAPADNNMRTLKIYVGLYGARANFEAFLSDFSGRAFTDTSLSNVFGNRYVVYTIDYAAASPGQRLIVRQTIGSVYDFTYGNVTLEAATLVQAPVPPHTNLPPVVSITNPTNGALFTEPATFALDASASDSDGSIAQVEFFNGVTSFGVDTNSPYSVAVNSLAAGTYTLSAIATDNLGAKATNSVSIIVNALPTASITSPTNGAIFLAPASIGIAANANDSDGSVTNLSFFQNTAKLGENTISPYSFSWSNVAAGTYTLTVRVTDDRGATNTSVPVTISVTNASHQPVTIISPTVSGTTFRLTFATDAGRTYIVESVTAIPSTNWQTFTNIPGTGSNVMAQDNTTGAPQRFYRVLTQ